MVLHRGLFSRVKKYGRQNRLAIDHPGVVIVAVERNGELVDARLEQIRIQVNPLTVDANPLLAVDHQVRVPFRNIGRRIAGLLRRFKLVVRHAQPQVKTVAGIGINIDLQGRLAIALGQHQRVMIMHHHPIDWLLSQHHRNREQQCHKGQPRFTHLAGLHPWVAHHLDRRRDQKAP